MRAKGRMVILGLEITVIRACYVDNCIYVCDERKREFTSDLKNDPDTFYRLLEFFWALKVMNAIYILLLCLLFYTSKCFTY